VEQRREDELLALARLEAEARRGPGDVRRDLVRVHPQLAVLGLERVGEHAHGRQVRAPQLAAEARVVEHGAGVVAEREQHVVVVLVEAAGLVRGDDGAVEAVAHVNRDRDEVVDLLVRRLTLLRDELGRIVRADRAVALDHLLREVLGDGAVLRVVLEALRRDEVEQAVRVLVLAREQEALLGADECHRRAEDERPDIARLAAERADLALELGDLRAELAVPLAFGAAGALQACPLLTLGVALPLAVANRLLELLLAPARLADETTFSRADGVPAERSRDERDQDRGQRRPAPIGQQEQGSSNARSAGDQRRRIRRPPLHHFAFCAFSDEKKPLVAKKCAAQTPAA
jgi:hypothetical protein